MLTLLDPEAPRSREAFRVLDDLTAAVLEAAAAGPVLLVLEDMHWADRSTQDFAAALSRTARGRLLLVLTFRSDELHRRHPFRKTLAEISRTLGSRRIDLGGLGRDDIAGIVAARTDGPPDPSVVGSVLARSEGNPLYAEELLARQPGGGPRSPLRSAAGPDRRPRRGPAGAAPRRLGQRDPAGHRDARGAGGTRPGPDGGLSPGGAGRQRPAPDRRLPGVPAPLLREAAYDDLMPDERTRTHGRLAEILQARVDAEPDPGLAALSRLAFHWNAAHDLPRTLAASVRAGLAAKRLGAAEAITQLERALSLWDRVPDAEAVAGHPQAELVVLLGEAAGDQGDDERWHTLVRTAVDMLGPDPDRLLASRVYSALAALLLPHRGHDRAAGGDPAGRRVRRRLPDRGAGTCPGRPGAVSEPARPLRRQRRSRTTSHRRRQERGVRRSRGGCPLRSDPSPWCYLGHIGDALAGLEQAVALARAAGMVGQALDATSISPWGTWRPDRSIVACPSRGEGFEEGMALGLPIQAAMCGGAALQALLWRGRLDEAEQRLEELGELGLPASAALALAARGAVAGTR